MAHLNLLLPILCGALSIFGYVANAQPLSLNEIIAGDSDLTTLNTALEIAQLNFSEAFIGPITLFAPNNDGFALYIELLAVYCDQQYIAHLQHLLLLHVVESEIFIADLMDGQVVVAANEEAINVTIGATVTLSTADSNATVVEADAVSSGGVLHQINGVLLPSFISTSLIDLIEDLEGFTVILELLEFTGLATLLVPDVAVTLFAPTDFAFAALPDGALDYYRSNKSICMTLLSGHVISPQIVP